MDKKSLTGRNVLWGVALLSLCFLTVVFVPFVGSAAVVLLPLPVIYFTGKLGRYGGCLVLAVSLLVIDTTLRLTHAEGDISLFLLLGGLGVAIAEILGRAFSAERTVLFSTIAGTGLVVLMLAVHSAFLGQAPWAVVHDYLASSFRESMEMSAQLGAQDEQIALVRDHLEIIVRSLLYVFPALVLVGLAGVVCLNLLFSRALFFLGGLSFPSFGDLTRWHPPERMIWLFIGSGAAVLLPPLLGTGGTEIVVAGLNVLIVCLFVYFLQGLAVMESFFKTRRIPRLLKVLFYFLLLIQQYLLMLVCIIGLLDLWFDFRRLNRVDPEPRP